MSGVDLIERPPPGTRRADRDFLPTLARGLLVLRAFTQQNERMTLAEVARVVKLPRATVRRCLLTLQALGYVDADGRHFGVSPGVLTLAQAYLSSSALPRVAQPFLERLSDRLGASCSVSILHGDEVVYVARSSRKRLASLHRDVGTHLPAWCTSMGRVLLAELPEAEQENWLATHHLTRLTPHTLTDPAELRARLLETRQQGYSLVDQEMEIDLLSLAVPLRTAAGRVIAALNSSAQASLTTPAHLLAETLPALRATAAELRPLLVG